MTVALLGTFDVPNFGDLLFPLLARHRLRAAAPELLAWSPVGGRPFEDALEAQPLEALPGHAPLDGVILGGGNIVHAWSASRVYAAFDPPRVAAYPELWLGAWTAARAAGAPLTWNAPGVPATPGPVAARLLNTVASASDYVSVRDEGSRAHLRATGFEGPVDVVPDPAFEVARLWSDADLDAALQATFDEIGQDRPDRFVVLHASPQRTAEDVPALAAAFDGLAAAWAARPVLLAIGPCHGDGDLLRRVAARMASEPITVDRPRRLLEIAAFLARGCAYAGASMHGGITSAAFGRPTRFVVPAGDHKFPGVVAHLAGTARLCSRWDQAGPGPDDPSEGQRTRAAVEALSPRLDAHWRNLQDALAARHDGTAASSSTAPHTAHPGPDVLAPLLLEMLQTSVTRRHAVEESLSAAKGRIAWLEDAWTRERAARDALARGVSGGRGTP